jgi:hypothetical protein
LTELRERQKYLTYAVSRDRNTIVFVDRVLQSESGDPFSFGSIRWLDQKNPRFSERRAGME